MTAFFDETNLNITTEINNQQYGSKISLDESITIPNGYTFSFWIINGAIQENLPIDHQFTVTSSMDLVAVFQPSSKYLAVFMDTNYKMLDIQYIIPGQDAADPSITLPTKPGYTIDTPKWDKNLTNITSNTIFTLQYVKTTSDSFLITVSGGAGSGTYTFNQYATAVAPAVYNTEYFHHWEVDGNIVSYEPTYKFTVVSSKTILAVYQPIEEMNTPLVIMTDNLGIRLNYKTYLSQFYLPTGFTLIEYGIITSLTTSSITLDSPSILRYQGTNHTQTTNEYTMSIADSLHQYARAYLVAENTQGELIEFYSGDYLLQESTTEPFDTNIGATYIDGSYASPTGLTWNYIHARNVDVYPITGTGIMLRYGDSSLSTTLPTGVSSFSFDYRKAFTGTSVRQMKITLTDSSSNTVTYTSPTFGTLSGEETTVYQLAASNLNMSGPISVTIKLNYTGTTNKHVIIDNFQWTSYETSSIPQGNLLQLSSNTSSLPTVDTSGPYYTNEETLTLTAPTVSGYVFMHWLDVTSNQIISELNPYTFDISSNTSIKAIYEDTANIRDYTIDYYNQNQVDNSYTLDHSDTHQDLIGAEITINPSLYGFHIDTELSTLSGIVSSTTPLVLAVYYERNIYTVTFIDQSITHDTQNIKYQNLASEPIDPEGGGTTFVGWSTSETGGVLYAFTSPITQNLTLYSVWDSPSYTYEGYYEGADGLSGTTLTSFLYNLVNTGITRISYGDVRYRLDETDRDPNNSSNVLTIYDRQSVSGVWTGLSSSTTFNREHVWPNSRLGVPSVENSNINIASDIHNLRAAIPATNSSRSNKVFDSVTSSTTWFPGEADKGDVARIIFYMYMAYPNMRLTDNILPVDSPDNYLPAGTEMGRITKLLQWHLQDPVDSFEMNRNNVIYTIQNNRNPFIDHPEFVELIWGPITLSSGQTAFLLQHEYAAQVIMTVYVFDLNYTNKEQYSI